MSPNHVPLSLYNDPEFLITLCGYVEGLLPFIGPPIKISHEDYTVDALRWRPRGAALIPEQRFHLLYEIGSTIGQENSPSNLAARGRFGRLLQHCPHIGIYADAIDCIINTGMLDRLCGDLICDVYRRLRLVPDYRPTIIPFIELV
jgi:hypothetical protein